MSNSDVAASFLSSLPKSGEIHDPREGIHPEATLAAVELVDQSNGPALKLTYNNMVNSDGRSFEHQDRVTLPSSASEPFLANMFLNTCHDLGALPRTEKHSPLVDTEEDKVSVVNAFTALIGTVVSLKLKIDDKTGFLRSRFNRAKKAA